MTEEEKEALVLKFLILDMEAHDIIYERKTKQRNDNQNSSVGSCTHQPVSPADGEVTSSHCR